MDGKQPVIAIANPLACDVIMVRIVFRQRITVVFSCTFVMQRCNLDLRGDEEIGIEDVKELYENIKQLDAEEQTLVFLYLDSKSYKEISEILGISVTNVGTKLQRVKMKLKKLSHEDTKK